MKDILVGTKEFVQKRVQIELYCEIVVN